MTPHEAEARFVGIIRASYTPQEILMLGTWALEVERLQAERYALTGQRMQL